MKGAVFYGKEDLRIEEVAMPKADKGMILIKLHACGICGTDMHIFDGDEGAAPTPAGTVLGHEFSGEVIETGEGVQGIKVGDKVRISLSNYPLIGYEEKPFQKKDKVVESQLKGFARPSVTLDGEQCLEIYQADVRAILS